MKQDMAMAVGTFTTLGVAGLTGYIPPETVGPLCIVIGLLSAGIWTFSEWYETDSETAELTQWEGSE